MLVHELLNESEPDIATSSAFKLGFKHGKAGKEVDISSLFKKMEQSYNLGYKEGKKAIDTAATPIKKSPSIVINPSKRTDVKPAQHNFGMLKSKVIPGFTDGVKFLQGR